jgi:hypothetical protein
MARFPGIPIRGTKFTSSIRGPGDAWTTINTPSGLITATTPKDSITLSGIVIGIWTEEDDILVFSGMSSSGAVSVLTDLTDVEEDTPALNDVVIWNGSTWTFAPYNTTFSFSCSLTVTPSTSPIEIGTGVWKAAGELSFAASWTNGPATTAMITHGGWSNLTMDPVEGPEVSTEAVSFPAVGGTQAFTLAASKGSENATSSGTFSFWNRRFWGVSSTTDSYSEADIEALTNELSNSRGKTFTVTAAAGEYILYSYPSRLGAATFTVGGFEGGFGSPETLSITNASGYTEDYYVYRSTNSGLGATTVVVS